MHSTFAWYSATLAGDIGAADVTAKTVTVEAGSLTVGSDTVKLEFGTPGTVTELSDSDGKVWYYIDASHTKEKTGVADTAKVASVSYTISWSDASKTSEHISYAGQSVKFTISATGGRIVFVAAPVSNVYSYTALAANAAALNPTVTVDSDGALTGNTEGTVYFRVDGGDSTGTVTQDSVDAGQTYKTFGTITATGAKVTS